MNFDQIKPMILLDSAPAVAPGKNPDENLALGK